MKAIGITRKIDDLGRITLPIELRRNLDINIGDPIEIYVEQDRIVLQKYHAKNVCKCGSHERLTELHGQVYCEKCLKEALDKIRTL
ncbi:MAG TPA: AbrB/MazE/SpoVT family DNA-binding domain-containing protein [Lachnospiraceae bacterium]|nr:AbrB/MazE/SpoVT family DNA-binding domain-containing protein [Lachnospiraceae bacterium]